MLKFINLEYHPSDSRIRIVSDDVCQTLNERMGTGGGNVPLIMEIHDYAEVVGYDSRPSDSENMYRGGVLHSQ